MAYLKLPPETIICELEAADFAVEIIEESLPDQYIVVGEVPAD